MRFDKITKGVFFLEKFLGLGLKNALGLWCLFVLFDVMAKTLAVKYDVKGLSDLIKSS